MEGGRVVTSLDEKGVQFVRLEQDGRGVTEGIKLLRIRIAHSHPEILSSEQFRRIAYLG